MGILDKLHLSDLLKVASLSPRLQQLIMDHYITISYRLQHSQITVYVDDTVQLQYVNDKNATGVMAEKHADVLFVLQHFCHMFNELEVEIHPHGYQYIEEIQSFVNEYCSHAAQEVTLIRGLNDIYSDELNVSFVNASSVILEHYLFDPNDAIRLDVAFPLMQKLTVNQETILTHHYPYLTDITLQLFCTKPIDNYLSNFMRLNSQLRRIESTVFDDSTFLLSISELLPHLESLSLRLLASHYYTFDSWPKSQFRCVKDFNLTLDFYGPWTDKLQELLASIEFEQLETFSLYSENVEPLDFVIGMIVENTGVTNIAIDAQVSFEQLTRLIEPLPKLKELTLSWSEHTSRDLVGRFLEHTIITNHTLDKFTVRLFANDQVTYEDISEFIPFCWNYNEASIIQNARLLQFHRFK